MPEPTSDSLNAAIATALGMPREFVCPRCGGRHFGTANPTARTEAPIIGCHDEFNRRCNWMGSWADIPPPTFDTDGNAMLELAGAISKRPDVDFIDMDDSDGRWQATVYMNARPSGYGSGDTLPRALRDAAARALGLAAGGEGTR